MSLKLLVEFCDVRLEVPARSHIPLDLAVEISLSLPVFEELLRVFEEVFLRHSDFLLDFLLLFVVLAIFVFRERAIILVLFRHDFLILQLGLMC